MDSQENVLQQDKIENEQKAVQAASEVENVNTESAQADEANQPAPEAPAEETAAPASPAEASDGNGTQATADEAEAPKAEETFKKIYANKQEVLARAKEIAASEDNPNKDEVEHLKSAFYRFHIAEREQQQKDYLEAGGDPEKYIVTPDEAEDDFKAQMQVIREKRAKIFQQQEAEKEHNLKRKLEIIEKVKAMATSPEEANKSYNEFKALQQEWKEIKSVPAEKANEVWRNYQLYVEQFYDLLNLNREAREYDFKKNLELKTKLCEEAERLADENDVVSAFHQLQELHSQYREIGPVAKELREEIWSRFKAASTVVNKKHQQHFEQLRAQEEANLQKKTELCEQVEAIAKEENKNAADWENHSKQIMAIQQQWKGIGFAPQKMNVKIFERFRAACDEFFTNKAAHFKEMKQRYAENADKKRALVAKAQELAESTDWKATSDKLIALQKEWKTIGTVPKKLGDKLWSDFLTACNHFFEARKAAHAGTRSEEGTNLEKKRGVIEQLKAIAEEAADNIQETVQKLVEEYNSIGHVPYKEKDKVYKEFHDVLDKIYQERHVTTQRRRLDNFKTNLKSVAKRGEEAVDNERTRLMRRFEQLKQEVTTYENNLGFLNIASKRGNSLVDEMNRKVKKLKDEMELTRQKIKAIDIENKKEKTADEAAENKD